MAETDVAVGLVVISVGVILCVWAGDVCGCVGGRRERERKREREIYRLRKRDK